jgi:hypothetical protein
MLPRVREMDQPVPVEPAPDLYLGHQRTVYRLAQTTHYLCHAHAIPVEFVQPEPQEVDPLQTASHPPYPHSRNSLELLPSYPPRKHIQDLHRLRIAASYGLPDRLPVSYSAL